MKTSFLHTVRMVIACALFLSSPIVIAHGDNNHKTVKVAEPDTEQHPWGVAAARSQASRTVNVAMLDTMRFEPASVRVAKDEVIRFVIANQGKLMHEFVLGTREALAEHAAMMVKFPNMEHEAPYMAHVQPGQSGEIVWKFNRDGRFEFGCLIPGHFQAGMIGAVKVGASTANHANQRGGQAGPVAHGGNHDTKPMLVAQAGMAKGQIKRIKKGSNKVTIKHGEIANLKMPPMTMVFQADNAAMLSNLKKGDNILFNAIERDGKMVITAIEPAN